MGTGDHRSATVSLADQTHHEITLLSRALMHSVGLADDAEAMAWAERRAAAGRPSAELQAFAEERERQQLEAMKRMEHGVPFDAHADSRPAREAMYAAAGLPEWRPER